MNCDYVGILGYSDENILLAPSQTVLQEMLQVCEVYMNEHSLKFSTDKDPNKSKTKCMAYLKRPRHLPNLILCGNPLVGEDGKASGSYLGGQM